VRRDLTWPEIIDLGRKGVEAHMVDGPNDYMQDTDEHRFHERRYLCFVPVDDALAVSTRYEQENK
jgi:hypothetical protein